MEKIIYLFKRVVESEQLAYIGPAISKVQRLAGGENLNSLNGLLSIAKAFSIKVIFVPDFGAKVRVSGWSDIDNGQRYIFLSRNCSECHLVHSMQHELGHHLLDHLFPGKVKNGIAEFEASMFASLLFLLGDKDYNQLTKNCNENPEIILFSVLLGLGTLSLLAAGVIWELSEWVSNKLSSRKYKEEENKVCMGIQKPRP